jgi:acetyl-CoA acyltransferase
MAPAGARAGDLAAVRLTALMERNPSVDWMKVDDVILGCANHAGEENHNGMAARPCSARSALV